jgi:hypothetical protein
MRVLTAFFTAAERSGLKVEFLDYFHVPIGSGMGENAEWPRASEVSDKLDDRKKFLVCYSLKHDRKF